MGLRVTRGSHGERYHIYQPSLGYRNTDSIPEWGTNNLEIRKKGLTIKLLESQRGQTDVTKSRQPWEQPNMVCGHTCTSHLARSSALGSALSTTAGACGQHPPVPPVSCPPQHSLAAALEHSDLGFTQRAQLSWARHRGPSQQCHPASAPGGSHSIPTDLKGMNSKQHLGKSKSCWLFHVAEQLPAEVWAPDLALALPLLLGSGCWLAPGTSQL